MTTATADDNTAPPVRYQRIVLHAGQHKTGTTSVQENCFRHRDLLLQHGIYYPVFNFRERQIFNHSDPLSGAISSRPQGYGMARRQGVEEDPDEARSAFSEQLSAVLEQPRGSTLLLSAEMVGDYAPDDLQALRTRLLEHTDELQVIVYIRSPHSSLASILQQRVLSGSVEDPHNLVGVVRQRFERLRAAYADILQVINFHEAIGHANGLVGHLLCQAGMPAGAVAGMEFSRANPRMSTEAFRLMYAINSTYPVDGQAEHGVTRRYHDTRPLTTLPGQAFGIEHLHDPDLYEAVRLESQWLEQELGFTFPPMPTPVAAPLWQQATLLELEAAVSKLEQRALRERAAQALAEEAGALAGSRADTAAILDFIATRVSGLGEYPRDLALEKLGPDYFKFAALQVERASPEMALYLMSLARHLRPEGGMIEERLKHYRDKLAGN